MKPQRASAADVRKDLAKLADPKKAAFLKHFFRTGPGEYGEGDRFLGVTVPEQRRVALRYRYLPLSQVARLLGSPVHDVRFCGVAILVERYRRGGPEEKQRIFDFYLSHRARVNNWDLIDVSARQIVGEHLVASGDMELLNNLAASRSIWDRRIAVVASWAYTKHGNPRPTLKLARRLIGDPHDLIHKAVGWMLREVGKQDQAALLQFLDAHSSTMPRVMLRYATERLPAGKRKKYITIRQVISAKQKRLMGTKPES